MAKQTRLATTLTARYFPTAELTDAFYMDGRVTSKTVARSADLTNDKEDRGFFFSIFSHQTNPDQDPNVLPPYEPVLRRLGTELKSGRRSLDDQIGEMVNTATSITGRMKIQQDNARAPFFAGVIVKDAEAFAITIGKGLAFLYRDDTLYPMTAADIRIDAINTQRQKVDNFFNFCATKTAPALCSNIAQLKLDDCIILCNREVYEALGQQELLRILYDAEDQSDAASVVMTEAAAKLPGVPLQFMISFVEDITSSDRGGFFGFGRKKKKAVQEMEEDNGEEVDDYDIAPAIPLESPKKEEKPLPKDALLFEDEDVEPKKEPVVPAQPKVPQTTVTDKTERRRINTFASQVAAQVNATTEAAGAGASGAGVAAGAVAGAVAGAAGAASSKGADIAKESADAVKTAIETPIPEPPLVFGDIHDLMKEEANANSSAKPATPAAPTAPVVPAAPVAAQKPAAPTISSLVDDGATKVLPVVDAKSASLPSFGDTGVLPVTPATQTAPVSSPFVQPKTPETPVLKDVTGMPSASALKPQAATPAPKKEEPFVAVKNSENPFFKAAIKAQNEENKVEEKKTEEPANVSFEVGGQAPVDKASEPARNEAKDEAPLFLGDDPFGGIVATEKTEPAKAEQAAEETAKPEIAPSGAVAETDETIPLVFEADDEVKSPMSNESENDPKKFDETPLFFGDAEPSADEEYESHLEYPSDYEPASSIPAPQQPEPAVGDDFVIPFASNDIPQAAQSSANDVPEMPLYEAPSYTPPTYPTNSDTPIGYEDTGVYARGSYTVDEDDLISGAKAAGTPVSPFVADAAPSFGDPAGYEVPSVEPAPYVEEPVSAVQDYVAPQADVPEYQTPAENVNSYTSFDEPADYAASLEGVPPAEEQYDFDNPPPAVADLFDFAPSGRSDDSYSNVAAGAASSVPAYMQQNSVSSSEVPGVPKRQQGGEYRRPGGRPNVAPPRRRVEEVDDGFDDEEGEETNYLPFILAAISVICLIVIIILIVHSCGSSKKPVETSESSTSIEETSDTSATEDTTTTAAETTAVPADAPIGVYTFSDNSGCRTWWDLFYHVYGTKIESESDKRVAFIKEYNNLDASYTPKAGDSVKLPPAVMLPQGG